MRKTFAKVFDVMVSQGRKRIELYADIPDDINADEALSEIEQILDGGVEAHKTLRQLEDYYKEAKNVA